MQALVRNKDEQAASDSQIEKKNQDKGQKARIRLVPLWARIIIVLVLVIMALAGGAMIGYSVMGDGEALDVFKKSTWTHIGDLVNKGTPDQGK